MKKRQATDALDGTSAAEKHELLFRHGINFGDIPSWQKRGIGLYWEEYEKRGRNPVTEEVVLARRRRIKTDLELPMKDEYSNLVGRMLRRGLQCSA